MIIHDLKHKNILLYGINKAYTKIIYDNIRGNSPLPDDISIGPNVHTSPVSLQTG